jgi:hypothetical protein
MILVESQPRFGSICGWLWGEKTTLMSYPIVLLVLVLVLVIEKSLED